MFGRKLHIESAEFVLGCNNSLLTWRREPDKLLIKSLNFADREHYGREAAVPIVDEHIRLRDLKKALKQLGCEV